MSCSTVSIGDEDAAASADVNIALMSHEAATRAGLPKRAWRTGGAVLMACAAGVAARQAPPIVPPIAAVRPIEPPAKPLPPESATVGVAEFSIIAYGDTRCDCIVGPSNEVQTAHAQLVGVMIEKKIGRGHVCTS